MSDEASDQITGREPVKPEIENDIKNDIALDTIEKRRERTRYRIKYAGFPGALSRGQLIEDLRTLFSLGADYAMVYEDLRTAGYTHRTRCALLDDALSTGPPEDPRTEEEKSEARILRRLKRAK